MNHSFSWFEKLKTQADILAKTLYVYNFDLFNMTACPQFQTAQKRDDQWVGSFLYISCELYWIIQFSAILSPISMIQSIVCHIYNKKFWIQLIRIYLLHPYSMTKHYRAAIWKNSRCGKLANLLGNFLMWIDLHGLSFSWLGRVLRPWIPYP